MSIYAIGDVQGCFQSLQALLAQLPLSDDDKIWLCGDLVNRGPHSLEVLRWVKSQGDRVVTVLGNHDLHLLAAAAGTRKLKSRDTFSDVLAAPDCEELLAWLRTRPLVHREANFLLVHAGLHPDWSMDQCCALASECERALREDRWLDAWAATRQGPQSWSSELVGDARMAAVLSILVSVRTIDERGTLNADFTGHPSIRPKGSQPWFELCDQDETIVFGHWAALGLYLSDRFLGIDTGCVWGGELTAVRLGDRKVFRQPALEKQS